MSLNYRIYFRDNQSTLSSGLQVSDRVHLTAATSIHFSGTRSESQGQTTESFQLSAQTVEVDQVKVDGTSVNGSPVSATAVLTSFC